MHVPGKLNPVASFILFGGALAIVLAFLVVSGIANISVWWNSAEGWNRYVFSTIGIGAEGWGAIGLVLMVRRWAQGQWSRALIALLLWIPAVGFNGYSTYRYFAIEGSDKAVIAQQEATKADITASQIAKYQADLEVIGVTRSPETIQAQIDSLNPDRYRTLTRQLQGELDLAKQRVDLEAKLEAAQNTSIETAGASQDVGEGAITDWRIIAALVVWMECVKALGLVVVFGKSEQPAKTATKTRTPRKTQTLAIPANETAPVSKPAPEPITAGPGHRVVRGPDGQERVLKVY